MGQNHIKSNANNKNQIINNVSENIESIIYIYNYLIYLSYYRNIKKFF